MPYLIFLKIKYVVKKSLIYLISFELKKLFKDKDF